MFHVPERARITYGSAASDASYGCNGAFVIESPEHGWMLSLIASDATDPSIPQSDGWEHVSVHAFKVRTPKVVQQRTPTWREMAHVKDVFWDAEDVVMQLHPRRSAYVNHHPHVLHLWRSRRYPIPEPPSILVGPS